MNTSEENTLPPSKTQRKHAMEELQSLGEELVRLSAEKLGRIALPDALLIAVKEAQRMTRLDEARRRQMQYIGRLMRKVDGDPIRAALEEASSASASETARLHRLEKMRDDLLADEKALQEIASRYPAIDLQHLRSLRRAALKEREQEKPPRNFRAIFQLLKNADQDDTLPAS